MPSMPDSRGRTTSPVVAKLVEEFSQRVSERGLDEDVCGWLTANLPSDPALQREFSREVRRHNIAGLQETRERLLQPPSAPQPQEPSWWERLSHLLRGMLGRRTDALQ